MKTTVLNQAHRALGAKMVPFAGYEMPIQYSSIVQEHLAVRQAVGMFDVSHMGEFWIEGPQALAFLQWVSANDASKLKVGRAQYSMLPNASGGLVDDIYVYHTQEGRYLMVVNAANLDKDWQHLQQQAQSFAVTLQNASEQTALIAVQGPQALTTLQSLCGANLSATRKNDTLVTQLLGHEVRLARTGYTGEDGFEVFVEAQNAQAVWEALLQKGVVPCGLGARDTLRLEAGFPLYGHEFSDTTNPLCTPLAWAVKLHKDLLGKEAMQASACERRMVGLLLEQGIPREGYAVHSQGQVVGQVTSGSQSPILKKGIALAYVQTDLAQEGQTLEVEIRGKTYPARVVGTPFVELK